VALDQSALLEILDALKAAGLIDRIRQRAAERGVRSLVPMRDVPQAVIVLADRLTQLGWVCDLFVAGSLATGDYVPGVSDLDLVAVVAGPVDGLRLGSLIELHRELDGGVASGLDLGCVYADDGSLLDSSALHPMWTHGELVRRSLSGVARAELVRHGFEIIGRAPQQVLPPVTDADVRSAARAEICGYWAWAAHRPWMWLNPVIADLGLTSMARGRHALRTGALLTKTQAVESADAPRWLIEQLRARRRGEDVASPRLLTGWIAWRDACRTVSAARRGARQPAR
jgi:Nucleotidyltransferase domain